MFLFSVLFQNAPSFLPTVQKSPLPGKHFMFTPLPILGCLPREFFVSEQQERLACRAKIASAIFLV
jgi:hypothetical protein